MYVNHGLLLYLCCHLIIRYCSLLSAPAHFAYSESFVLSIFVTCVIS